MAQVLPAGDKIKDYDSRVDPDAPAHEAKVCRASSHYYLLVQPAFNVFSGTAGLFCVFHEVVVVVAVVMHVQLQHW